MRLSMFRKILIGAILVLTLFVSGVLVLPRQLVKAHTLVIIANYTQNDQDPLHR
jgi:hypothetical protein